MNEGHAAYHFAMGRRDWIGLIAGVAVGAFLLTMTALLSPAAAIPPAIGAACLVILIALRPATGGRWLAGLPGAASIAATVSVLVTGQELSRADGLYGIVEVALLCLLLAGIVRWFRGALLWACALVTAGAAVSWLIRFLPDRDAGPLVAGVALWSVPALVAVVVGGYPRLAANRLRNSVARARDEQRAALERDLHDYVAHDITGMVVQAQAARFAAGDDPQRLREALDRIETSGQRAMASMDRAIELLRDDANPTGSAVQRPGLDQLPQLVTDYQSPDVGTPTLDVDGDLTVLPREVSETLYRLCVEALTNIRRHAPTATSIHVAVTIDRSRATVEVTNDGVTSSSLRRNRGGSGLRTARARIETLGGTLVANPMPSAISSGGWRVRADIPVGPTH